MAEERIAVLIISEDRKTVKRLKKILSTESVIDVVGGIASVEEYMRLVREVRPNIVLVDADMQDTDWFELARQIRDAQVGAEIFLLVAGYDVIQRANARAVGVGYFVEGPVGRDEFLWSIHDALRPPAYRSDSLAVSLEDYEDEARPGGRGTFRGFGSRHFESGLTSSKEKLESGAEADDEEEVGAEPPPAPTPAPEAAAPAETEPETETAPAAQPDSLAEWDSVEGIINVAGGDVVRGDKVAGDKITAENITIIKGEQALKYEKQARRFDAAFPDKVEHKQTATLWVGVALPNAPPPFEGVAVDSVTSGPTADISLPIDPATGEAQEVHIDVEVRAPQYEPSKDRATLTVHPDGKSDRVRFLLEAQDAGKGVVLVQFYHDKKRLGEVELDSVVEKARAGSKLAFTFQVATLYLAFGVG